MKKMQRMGTAYTGLPHSSATPPPHYTFILDNKDCLCFRFHLQHQINDALPSQSGSLTCSNLSKDTNGQSYPKERKTVLLFVSSMFPNHLTMFPMMSIAWTTSCCSISKKGIFATPWRFGHTQPLGGLWKAPVFSSLCFSKICHSLKITPLIFQPDIWGPIHLGRPPKTLWLY